MLWGFDALSGFFLKAVQHIHRIGDLNCVNRSLCVTHMVRHNFQHTSTAKSLQRLGLFMLLTRLREVQRKSKDIDDIFGHREKIFF